MKYRYEEIDTSYSDDYIDTIDQIERIKQKMDLRHRTFEVTKEQIAQEFYGSSDEENNTVVRNGITYILENNVTVRGCSFGDHLQARNYDDILELVKTYITRKHREPLTEDFICMLHKLVTDHELSKNESGQYRTEPVHIRTTDYIPPLPEEVPTLILELIQRYNKPSEAGKTRFEKICELKRNFERVHPFVDGNGRTGRLLMNILFLQNGYAFLSIPSEERNLYFESLEKNTFHDFAAEKMYKNMQNMQKRNTGKEEFHDLYYR